MAKNNNTKIITPVGVSQYAWLTTADTRFDEIGHFKTNLIVKTDKVQKTIKAIDDELSKSLSLAQEKNKGKKIKQADAPYFEELDDDGKPTGNTIFKFKTKAQIISKDGKVIPNRVAIFDSKGTPMVDANVWSGSEMKVSAELIPYYTAMAGAGVSLRLRAVQITKLVEGGSSNAKGYGFDEVEDGYQFESKDADVQETTEEEADF